MHTDYLKTLSYTNYERHVYHRTGLTWVKEEQMFVHKEYLQHGHAQTVNI